MQHDPDFYHTPKAKKPWWRSREAIVLIIFLSFAGFYLLTEHTAHLYSALPWLILLACPFLHFFMHRGHHHQQNKDQDQSEGKE